MFMEAVYWQDDLEDHLIGRNDEQFSHVGDTPFGYAYLCK
jgi:hypothetical protein